MQGSDHPLPRSSLTGILGVGKALQQVVVGVVFNLVAPLLLASVHGTPQGAPGARQRIYLPLH